jgi:voltage-gated potassium channel Kch
MVQLLFALGLTCATVLIHAFGTWVAIVYFARVLPHGKRKQGILVTEIKVVRVVSVLLVLHFVEAGIWAVFYLISGDLPDLETAIYFSMTSYTTLGYGDVVLPAPWRVLGPIEGAVGILMFGWSTAIIVAVITRIHSNRLSQAEGNEVRPPTVE